MVGIVVLVSIINLYFFKLYTDFFPVFFVQLDSENRCFMSFCLCGNFDGSEIVLRPQILAEEWE